MAWGFCNRCLRYFKFLDNVTLQPAAETGSKTSQAFGKLQIPLLQSKWTICFKAAEREILIMASKFPLRLFREIHTALPLHSEFMVLLSPNLRALK